MIPDYDIHERTGYRESMAIPNQQVAMQIVEDVVKENRFLKFVERLVRAQDVGIMGRRYQVSFLREILKGTYELGFIYDNTHNMFVENPRVRRTRNWGVLDPGVEYTVAFIRIDIAGNTELVRSYPVDVIDQTYDDLRTIVAEACELRNGRIWQWEGDGGLAAFYFGNKDTSAVISAMDIIHRLFLYNRLKCRLDEPLRVRIAVHSGHCVYTDNEELLKGFEIVKEVFAIERDTEPQTVTVSIVVKVMLDEILVQSLEPVDERKHSHFRYRLELEK